jgi:beta-glucosidase
MTRWVDRIPAIVQAWYPGQEGGAALSQILFGEFSPAGKLPVTFERRWEDSAAHGSYYPNADKKIAYSEGVFLGYRHFDKTGAKPLFSFGHGLSYSTFQYGGMTISPDTLVGEGQVSVSFEVTNTGTREAAEVSQLYVSDRHARVPRPIKELKGFAKTQLRPGQTKRVEIKLDQRALSYFDTEARRFRADPGEFEVLVGSSAEAIALRGKLSLR